MYPLENTQNRYSFFSLNGLQMSKKLFFKFIPVLKSARKARNPLKNCYQRTCKIIQAIEMYWNFLIKIPRKGRV
jgi:hypothetical protein